MNDNEAALYHAARGRFVFPCKRDKTPYTPHGFLDASTDLTQVARWWKQYPDALVGIACSMTGFFVLDVDDPESWNRFERMYSPEAWRPTLTQLTPRGGWHYFFRLPLDMNIPNNAGKLAPGLDLRSNGYVCTGTGYRWIGEMGIDQPIIDAPAWLLTEIDKLNPHNEQRAQLPPVIRVEGLPGYFLERAVSIARSGNRNNTGFDLAIQLRDCGLSESEARSYIIEYQARCPQGGHPYTQAEALASLRVAYTRPQRDPPIAGYGRALNGG